MSHTNRHDVKEQEGEKKREGIHHQAVVDFAVSNVVVSATMMGCGGVAQR
jgi:hypothetical protein